MIVTHVSLGEQELAYSLQDKLVIVRKEPDTVDQHKQMQSMVKAQGTAAQEVEEGDLQHDHDEDGGDSSDAPFPMFDNPGDQHAQDVGDTSTPTQSATPLVSSTV